jgi:hypothetical protein
MFTSIIWLADTLVQAASISVIVRVFVPALPVTEIVPAPTTFITPDPFGPIDPPVFPSRNNMVPGNALAFSGPA